MCYHHTNTHTFSFPRSLLDAQFKGTVRCRLVCLGLTSSCVTHTRTNTQFNSPSVSLLSTGEQQQRCHSNQPPLFFLAVGSQSGGMGKDSSSMGPHSVDTSTTVSIITSSAGVKDNENSRVSKVDMKPEGLVIIGYERILLQT